MKYAKPLIFSALIHSALFFKTEHDARQTHNSGYHQKINILEKAAGSGRPMCHSYYGGIGLVTDTNNVVISVPYGYPAYKAQIRIGDIVLNQDELRGKPGTRVFVNIKRDLKILPPLSLVREKICTNPDQ